MNKLKTYFEHKIHLFIIGFITTIIVTGVTTVETGLGLAVLILTGLWAIIGSEMIRDQYRYTHIGLPTIGIIGIISYFINLESLLHELSVFIMLFSIPSVLLHLLVSIILKFNNGTQS